MAETTTTDSQTPSPGLVWLMLAGFVAGFHAMGRVDGMAVDWSDPVRWLAVASPETVLTATVRAIGLAISYWTLITATLYSLAGRRAQIPQWLHRITLPPVRRCIDRALTTGLAASITFAPTMPAMAVEEEPPAIVFEIHDGVPIPHLGPAPLVVAEPGGAPDPPSASVPARAENRESPSTSGVAAYETYAVAAGDNLWAIAARHLESAMARKPTSAEITNYWRSVVASNQSNLRSGDPNLIFPGELLSIPPVR
jgi:hypothetical protein